MEQLASSHAEEMARLELSVAQSEAARAALFDSVEQKTAEIHALEKASRDGPDALAQQVVVR